MKPLPPDAACPPVAGLLSVSLAGILQPVEAAFFPHIACAIFRDRPEFCDKFGEVPGPLESAVVTARPGVADGPQKQAGLATRRAARRLFELCDAALTSAPSSRQNWRNGVGTTAVELWPISRQAFASGSRSCRARTGRRRRAVTWIAVVRSALHSPACGRVAVSAAVRGLPGTARMVSGLPPWWAASPSGRHTELSAVRWIVQNPPRSWDRDAPRRRVNPAARSGDLRRTLACVGRC